MVLADVKFSAATEPPLPVDHFVGYACAETFFIVLPLPAHRVPDVPVELSSTGNADNRGVYRIGCGIPASMGEPPRAPPTQYLQSLLDKYGPTLLSSDPAVNPHPIRISETIWSTRFRNRAAIAEDFFVRYGKDADAQGGGVVFLIGDAAHIHSPGKITHLL